MWLALVTSSQLRGFRPVPFAILASGPLCKVTVVTAHLRGLPQRVLAPHLPRARAVLDTLLRIQGGVPSGATVWCQRWTGGSVNRSR